MGLDSSGSQPSRSNDGDGVLWCD